MSATYTFDVFSSLDGYGAAGGAWTEESEVRDPWVSRMRSLPATVVSTTLEGTLDWPDATVESGDAVDVVARLKESPCFR
jgi:hypothetical protein